MMSENNEIGSVFRGKIDKIDEKGIYGWATRQYGKAFHTTTVSIYGNGELLGTVTPRRHRKDLEANGIGDGHFSFIFLWPHSMQYEDHELLIIFDGTDTQLPTPYKTSHLKDPLAIEVHKVGQLLKTLQVLNLAIQKDRDAFYQDHSFQDLKSTVERLEASLDFGFHDRLALSVSKEIIPQTYRKIRKSVFILGCVILLGNILLSSIILWLYNEDLM